MRMNGRSGWWGLVVFGTLVVLTSCRITDHREDDMNANDLNVPASGYAPMDTSLLPRFQFDSVSRSFGHVTEGTHVDKLYHFRNVGESDLIIAAVRGSCGCTVGKNWPHEPVKPGEAGTIEVTFDSSGRSGRQEKTISV